MNKYLKYTLRGFLLLISLIVVIYIGLYIYISVNKKQIIEQARKEMAERLDGDVAIKNIELSIIGDFPHIAVAIENISIKDSLAAKHGHTFFQAKKVFVRLNMFKLIQKRDPLNGVRIENGQLYVYTDTSGYTNEYLFKGKEKAGKPANSNKNRTIIKELVLKNVRLIKDDRRREKLYDFSVTKLDCDIKTSDTALTCEVKTDMLVHDLGFNLDKGSYLKETSFKGDFNFSYYKPTEHLSFKKIEVDLKEQPFVISADFFFNNESRFRLQVESKKLDYNLGRSLLTKKIASTISRFKVSAPIDVKATIEGTLSPGEPLVKVEWASGNANVETPFFNLKQCTFSGGYTNELVPGLPRYDENSRIWVHNFNGIWEGLDIHSNNVYIDNLTDPMINCDIQTDFELATLNNLLSSKSLSLTSGRGLMSLTYSGPLAKNNTKNSLINGKILLKNGTIIYNPRSMVLNNCNGNIIFKNSDVLVNNLSCDVQGNKINMNGVAKNMMSLIKTSPGKISLDWHILSPALKLETFTGLLKKRKAVVVSYAATGKLNKVASQMDDMLNQANVKLELKADKLSYKRFVAKNVNAAIELIQDNWMLKNISLQHGNGSMKIDGYLREKNDLRHEASLNANMNNVDVNEVLYSFNNFGQDAIMSQNLKGKLTTDIHVTMDLDRDLTIAPTNLEGYIDFSLKKGALINFEPIQKLQNFLFKNRNFEEIYFAELKDRFDLKDREIMINRMEIQSTALTLFVEGVYSLKGKTDLSIQVPLSNLKKRTADYKPENVGADAKGGTSIYLRGKPGDDGNIAFKYDLFKKFRGSKTKEQEPK